MKLNTTFQPKHAFGKVFDDVDKYSTSKLGLFSEFERELRGHVSVLRSAIFFPF